MEYVISIAKRYNHARTHYRDPRNRGIKGAKPVLGIYVINGDGKLRFRKISVPSTWNGTTHHRIYRSDNWACLTIF
ncbi:MAG: hypothetical protein KGI28_07775 [Thaumarchaeota archaeon]|nr:hypothetical protein [Nitrososphaerota archaeon]